MRVAKPHFFISILLLLLFAASITAQDATPTATPEPATQVLSIWWPDILVIPDNAAIQTVLQSQTQAFVDSRENIRVDSRLKRVGANGGIMATLRTASLVAEGALPALTLIRRQDLIAAERAGLLQSIEGMIPSSIQGDLDSALQLGQVNNELYGLPYMLELQLVIYRPQDNIDYSDWSYNSLLNRNIPFVFAGGRAGGGGLSDVALLQYVNSGGSLAVNGELLLDEEALRQTLEFYEQATTRQLIDPAILDYLSQNDYLVDFVDGKYDAGVFSSTQYLRLLEDDSHLHIAPIPTASGRPTSILNGWMWVLIASDPDQQELALDYIMWMMDTTRQAEFAQVAHMIPSESSAILPGLAANADTQLILDLLDNAALPTFESEGGSLARTIQEALASVIRQENTAQQAINFVLNQQ